MNDKSILHDYILQNYRDEFLSGDLTEKQEKIIENSFNFQVYLCGYYLKKINENIVDIFKIILNRFFK